MSSTPYFTSSIYLPTTLSDFIRNNQRQSTPSTSAHISNTSLASSTTAATSTTSSNPHTQPRQLQNSPTMAFGRRRQQRQVVTRETKPTLMTRLRGRNANTRTVKTTTTVHPAGHTHHSTAAHHSTVPATRRSRWGGRSTRTAQPVVHHRRHASLGDKISGAMMKLKGSLTHRPGVKVCSFPL